MRKIKRFGIPVLVVAALALVGAGFTNSLSFGSNVTNNMTGFGKVTLPTGVSVSNITYGYVDGTDQSINAETLTFGGSGVPDDEVVKVGWNGGSVVSCTGTGDTGTGIGDGDFTGATCTAGPQSVSTAADFEVLVLPN
jgi:hypothetical protein